jgi:hypothetical protein
MRQFDVVVFQLQQRFQALANIRFVVYYEDSAFRGIGKRYIRGECFRHVPVF